MGDSQISWTKKVWNPVTGCSVVSPGCEHCYAESYSLRKGWSKKPWTAINAPENVVLHPDRLEIPKHWREGALIFVNSMSDLWHEQIDDAYIDLVMETICETPRHVYQVLTKRSARMKSYLLDWIKRNGPLPPGLWPGVTTEDQRRANERVPDLMSVPASVLFVSAEPLLSPIDFRRIPYRGDVDYELDALDGQYRMPGGSFNYGTPFSFGMANFRGTIGWVIDGGESGAGRRPAEIDWYRSIRDQCLATRVPYFHKQGSHFYPGRDVALDDELWHQFPKQAGALAPNYVGSAILDMVRLG